MIHFKYELDFPLTLAAAQSPRYCLRRAKFCLNRNWFALPAPGLGVGVISAPSVTMDKMTTLKIAGGVETLGDSGFLQFFRVVSSDYGKPRFISLKKKWNKRTIQQIPVLSCWLLDSSMIISTYTSMCIYICTCIKHYISNIFLFSNHLLTFAKLLICFKLYTALL